MFDVTPITSEKQVDCGATCLQMLLAYYGIDVALETLIEECNTRLIGCSGADILRVARAHGLDGVTCYDMDKDEIIRQDRPGIIWWKYNHWVVFCGVDERGKVVICNPDKGRYRMEPGTFASFATGQHDGKAITIWNGEPQDMDTPTPDGGLDARVTALEDELEAAKILLGVE